MPEPSPIFPIWILFSGSLISAGLGRWMRPVENGYLALATFGGAFVSLVALKVTGKAQSLVSLWPPSPSLGGGLVFRADPLALACAITIVGAGFLALLAWIPRHGSYEEETALMSPAQALAGGAVACLFAANGVTLYMAWGLLDLALLLFLVNSPRGHGPALRAISLTSLTGLILLALALRTGPGTTPFLARPLPSLAGVLLLLVALSRLGLYPLHLGLLAGWDSLPHPLIPLLLAPWAVGAYFTAQLLPALPGEGLNASHLMAFATVAIMVSSVLAWWQRSAERALGYVVVHQSGLLFLLALTGGGVEDTGIACYVASCMLSMVALFSLWPGERLPPSPWPLKAYRWLTAIALASLVGAPFTLGFVGRWSLGSKLLEEGQGLIWTWITLAGILIVGRLAHLWRRTPLRANGGEMLPAWLVQTAAVALLVILGASFGGMVGGVSHLSESLASMPKEAFWALAISTVALALGLGAYRLPWESPWWAKLGAKLEALLGLEWLYRLAARIALGASQVLWALAQMAEGRYYMGWIFLMALVVIILVLAV